MSTDKKLNHFCFCGKALLLLFSFFVISCTEKAEPTLNSAVITINSKVFKEDRAVYLQLPKSFNQRDAKRKKYPLIVVLDGDQYFEYVSGMVEILAAKEYMPEALVLAIPPVNRNWELTPPIAADPNLGGADKLIEFMDQELFPYLYEHYPLLEHKTIIGHSYGGLWALYNLFEYAESFDYYLASDPSYTLYANKYAAVNFDYQNPKRLFLAIANTLPKGGDTLNLKPTENQQHIVDLFYLRDKANLADPKDLILDWAYYPNNSHGNVMIPAFEDGLKSLFSWFPMDKQAFSIRENPTLTDEQILDNFQDYVAKLKAELSMEAVPDETQLFNIMRFIPFHKKELTLEFLLINQKYYPDSFNSNQALGLFFYHEEQPEKAAYYFQKALDIRADKLTSDMLKELGFRSYF